MEWWPVFVFHWNREDDVKEKRNEPMCIVVVGFGRQTGVNQMIQRTQENKRESEQSRMKRFLVLDDNKKRWCFTYL